MDRACSKCGFALAGSEKKCPRCGHAATVGKGRHQPPVDSTGTLLAGTVIGKDYRIVRAVGRGGAGTVYEARQISLQHMPVALKVLDPEFVNKGEACIALLQKEVIISRGLTHHNIIKLYNLEKLGGGYFIVMEFVDGVSLQTMIRRAGQLTLDEFGPVFLQVCDALDYAHGRGVVHLDIKPGNILVADGTHVKLCDFGIARVFAGTAGADTRELVIGSIGFMPPEQYTGRTTVDPRSDIYSLGATAYCALTGITPSENLRWERVPSSVARAMQLDPENRFESIKEFRRAFVRETGIGPFQQLQTRPVGGSSDVGNDAASEVKSAPSSIRSGDRKSAGPGGAPSGASSGPARRPATAPSSPGQRASGASPVMGRSQISPERGGPPTTGRKGPQQVTEPWPSVRIRPILAVFAVVAVLVGVLAMGLRSLRGPGVPGAVAKFQVSTVTYDWFDEMRHRPVPVRIYYPSEQGGPFPAIMYSHPLGGSRDFG